MNLGGGRRNMRQGIRIACLAIGLGGAASTARAQAHDWVSTLANGNSTGGSVFQNRLYYAVDTAIEGHNLAQNGTVVGKFSTPTASTIENFPVVVPLLDTNNYLFVTANDGSLYKLDTPTLALSKTAGKAQSRDLRRAGCKVGATPDALQATPTVQLNAYANAAYRNAQPRDLVFVPTYHGCGDTSLNQIIALDAADITGPPVWIFNAGGEYQVDYISEGCSIDYTRNVLYCGANLASAHAQNTVWAISTLDGSLLWSANMNSIHNRPQLGLSMPQHLYVADILGRVHALNPDTGHEDWSVIITSTAGGSTHGVSVTQNLWAEFRAPYDGMVLLSDSTGVLTAIYDGGAEIGDGVKLWSRNFAASVATTRVTSVPGVAPTFGKVYVGLNDGTMHQLSMSSGADEATRNISNTPTAGDLVTDPAFNIANGANDINKIIVSSAGTSGAWMKQFTVPFNGSTGTQLTTCNADTDCVSFNAPRTCMVGQAGNECCTVGKCDLSQHFCYEGGTAKGALCNDGLACTKNDVCNAGTCAGKWDTTTCPYGSDQCAIPNRFDQGCGPGMACRKDPVSGVKFDCVDVDSGAPDSSGFTYCGSLSRSCDDTGAPTLNYTWGGHRICDKGVCKRDKNICSYPTTANFQATGALKSAAAINFSRYNLDSNKQVVGSCDGYTSTYQATDPPVSAGPPLFTFTNNTCLPINPNLPLCGRNGYISLTKATPSTGALTFTDPFGASPTTGASIERVQLTVRGYIPGTSTCSPASLTVKLNGSTLGTFAGKTSACASSCAGATAPCFDIITVDQSYNPDTPPPDFTWSGSNTLTLSLSGIGTIDVSEAELTITASLQVNQVTGVHKASTGAVSRTIFNSTAHPGYMHGVALTNNPGRSTTAEVFVPYVDRFLNPAQPTPWASIGETWTDSATIGPVPVLPNQTLSTPAAATDCDPLGKFGCPYPYTIKDYNTGPAPFASDTLPLRSPSASTSTGPGKLYIANYRFNGDLGWMRYICSGSTTITCDWNYTALVWKAGNPPYCPTTPCHERITALDAPPPDQTGTDGLLRVAWGSHLYFVKAGSGIVVYDLDLASTNDPSLTSGGSGNWATLGFENIDAILSLSIDSLNATNDTYLEVRERRGGTAFDYIVQVRNDHSARPYTNKWRDKNGNAHVGVATDLRDILVFPPGANFKDQEGRITAASQIGLHRLLPVAPTTGGTATLAQYDLAP